MNKRNRICIWCKYGDQKAEEIKASIMRQLMDCVNCPTCERTCISSTFMVEVTEEELNTKLSEKR